MLTPKDEIQKRLSAVDRLAFKPQRDDLEPPRLRKNRVTRLFRC